MTLLGNTIAHFPSDVPPLRLSYVILPAGGNSVGEFPATRVFQRNILHDLPAGQVMLPAVAWATLLHRDFEAVAW
jgi:hypothetical protein